MSSDFKDKLLTLSGLQGILFIWEVDNSSLSGSELSILCLVYFSLGFLFSLISFWFFSQNLKFSQKLFDS